MYWLFIALASTTMDNQPAARVASFRSGKRNSG